MMDDASHSPGDQNELASSPDRVAEATDAGTQLAHPRTPDTTQ